MFKRIKKWVVRPPGSRQHSADLKAADAWATAHGFKFESLPEGGDFALTGLLDGRPWRMERTAPGREFIMEAELRALAELGLPEDVSVMVINRPLKDELEKHVYEQVTDGVQTMLDADMPEEARWLALYDEVGWSTAPMEFWDHYAIVADSRNHAEQWLEWGLMSLLLHWPTPAVQQMTPFILQMQRGRVYLRMEYPQADLPTLEHALAVFMQSCVSARSIGGS